LISNDTLRNITVNCKLVNFSKGSFDMKRVVLVVIGVFCISGVAFGAEVSKVLKEIKGRDAKIEALAKDVTMVMDSKMVSQDMEMQTNMKAITKGKKRRTEMTMMGMKTIVVNNGSEIWMVSAQQGKKKMNSESEGGQTPFGQADNIKEDGLKVSEGTVNDKKCFILEGQDNQNNQCKWYFDSASFALLKYETKMNGQNMVLVNSGFKKVKGDIEMPSKMEFTTDGKLTMSGVVKSIEFNKGIKDEIFDVDSIKQEELGKMDMEMMMKMMKK